jgi:response regulator RpfG family c-di-GMP phosphodiesterase
MGVYPSIAMVPGRTKVSVGLMARALNMLLVENSDDEAFLFKASISTLPISVTHVRDAEAGVQFLNHSKHLPDLIVLELVLSGMSAADFLDWAGSTPSVRRIPTFIYTGSPIIETSLKSAVRAAFYKTPNTAHIRTMVQQMCAVAAKSAEQKKPVARGRSGARSRNASDVASENRLSRD